MKGWLILWINYKRRKATQKLLTLRHGTNGKTLEPQKTLKAILKNGKLFVNESGREEKMKETGRIKLKDIPFSQTFETGNGEELCNATGYAVQFDNEKTPLGFPLFWNEFQDREGNLYYGN